MKPLNEVTLARMFRLMHRLTAHSPDRVRLKHKQMQLRWDRRFDRDASVKYTNTYSLHRFL